MTHNLLTDEQIEALPFEEALQHLEVTVNELESGHVPLEKAIELFQQGMKLAKRCHIKLEKIEQKIEILLEKDGEFLKKPLQPEGEME